MTFGDVSQRFKKLTPTTEAEPVAQIDPAELVMLRARITGVLIRDARIAKGFTVEQLAGLMQIEAEAMLDWEFGEDSPSLPQLELLAYWLEVPVSHFLSGTQTLTERLAERHIDHAEYRLTRDHMIGALVAKARSDAGFTLAYLSEQIGLEIETLQAYEYGHAPIPLPDLVVLAAALRVTPAYFLEGNDRVGKFLQAQELFDTFLKMEPELRRFVANPSSHPYIELSMKLAEMDIHKLRGIAEAILEITF